MRNHEAVTKVDKVEFDQDGRQKLKIAHPYFEFKDEFIECYPTLSRFETVIWSELTLQVIKSSYRSLTQRQVTPHRSGRSKSTRTQRPRDKEDALRGRYGAGSERMGSANRICTQKEQRTPNSRGLPQTNDCDQQKYVPDPTHGRMYQFAWRGRSPLRALRARGKLGYCKGEIEEEHQEKTAFTSHHGLYGFVSMQFPKIIPVGEEIVGRL